MTSQIVKVRSNESGNFNKLLNKMTFQVPSDGRVYNLRDSYLLLNMSVTDTMSNQISFGQDNLPMDATCMFKRVKLRSSKKGDLEEILNVHILRENLNYWQKGENQDKSRSLFGYTDEISNSGGNRHYESFFSDQPKNAYVWLKDILGIGSLSNLDSDSVGELTLEIEFENSMSLFQQRVLGLYDLSVQGQIEECADVAHNVAIIVPNDLQILTKLAVGMIVNIGAFINGALVSLERYITAIQAGVNFTVNAVLDAAEDATEVTVSWQDTSKCYICAPVAGAIGQVTINNLSKAYQDLQVGTKCTLQYATIIVATGALVHVAQQVPCTITALNLATGQVTLSNQVGGNVAAVAAPAAGNTYTAVSFAPLGASLPNAVWNITKAECILYKLVGAPKSSSTTVFTTWSWEARQALANLRFEDTFRLENNVYNAYCLTPLPNKLYSCTDGMSAYRFYVDDQSITDRDISVDSSLHIDNLLTVLSNSQDSVKNLSKSKTDIDGSPYIPFMAPCKVYQRSVMGQPNYMGSQGLPRQLRVVLDNQNNQKLVYVFKEKLVAL